VAEGRGWISRVKAERAPGVSGGGEWAFFFSHWF
jgi:hypothetical protein